MTQFGCTDDESLAAQGSSPELRELILYVADRCRHEPTFGKTALNKILYFADFMHYAGTGESLTGINYVRRQRGPAPEWNAFRAAFEQLQSQGRLDFADVDYFGFPQKKPVAIKPPDVSHFTEKQLELVNHVAEHVCKYSATQISDITHEDLGWRLATEGEIIPYQTVWIRRKVCMSAEAVGHMRERMTHALAIGNDNRPNG